MVMMSLVIHIGLGLLLMGIWALIGTPVLAGVLTASSPDFIISDPAIQERVREQQGDVYDFYFMSPFILGIAVIVKGFLIAGKTGGG